MDYKKLYDEWCNNEYFDEATRAELKAIAGDDAEIKDRFYRELEFGTAGLRGVIGAGTNRMNFYTVSKATQGLANFILKEGGQDRGSSLAPEGVTELRMANGRQAVKAAAHTGHPFCRGCPTMAKRSAPSCLEDFQLRATRDKGTKVLSHAKYK